MACSHIIKKMCVFIKVFDPQLKTIAITENLKVNARKDKKKKKPT